MVLLYDRLVRKSRDFLDRNKSTHFDTEKSMPKEKENDRTFFLDNPVWPGYNGLMNGAGIAPSCSTFGTSH